MQKVQGLNLETPDQLSVDPPSLAKEFGFESRLDQHPDVKNNWGPHATIADDVNKLLFLISPLKG